MAFSASLPIEQLHSLLQQRHSCRGFLSRPVPRSVIAQILTVAQRTASWCNAQPWQLHIVSGPNLEVLRADLCDPAQPPAAPEIEFPREYRDIYQARRRDCGWELYRAVGIAKGDRAASSRQARENFRLFGAPHLLIVTSPEALGTYGVMDCGAWVSTFMLAATALGVASIAQAALAGRPDLLRKHVPIGADRRIVCGISLGYEDTAHPANQFRTTRAPLDEVVTWVGAPNE